MRFLGRALVFAVGLLIVSFAQADETIRILCPTWSGFAPVFVAADQGYFKKLGLTVDIKFEDERPNVMAAMARGDIEMDMRTIGEYQGRPRGPETPGIIIGTIDQSLGGDGVIAAGTITSAADLKGKIVASEPNIPGRLLLQLALKQAGLSLADLSLKDISTPDTVAVFSDSSIAAVATFQPFMAQALDKLPGRKPHILLSSKDYPGLIVDALIVRQNDLAKSPEKYRKFLIGLYRAIDLFKTNRTEFIASAAPHFDLDPAAFAESIEGSLAYTDFETASGFIGKPGAPGTLYQSFDTVMQLNLENGAADHKLAAAQSIDPSVIAKLSRADLGP
jgi:NitT/TauT family transport system substrate-binding protein